MMAIGREPSMRPRRVSNRTRAKSSAQPQEMEVPRRAYITLITRASYLAGVVILANSLRRHRTQYPLVVLYTTSLSCEGLEALALEATRSNMILHECDLLTPRKGIELNLAASRFTDTWTKLRVFETFDLPFDTFCYLDADMVVFKNMDSVFHRVDLPEDHIAAVHDCVCNTGTRGAWTPHDHIPENCPFSVQTHPRALHQPIQPAASIRPTHKLFNSGMFICKPNKRLWEDMITFFHTTDLLSTFAFPDQQFLTHFFRARWVALGWQYNAVKTMAYRHTPLWCENEIVCAHYINDKPWAKRVSPDGTAGMRGLDGETHRWWWLAYNTWVATRMAEDNIEVVRILSAHVAEREVDDGMCHNDEQPLSLFEVVPLVGPMQRPVRSKPNDGRSTPCTSESGLMGDFVIKMSDAEPEFGDRRRDSHLEE